MDALNKLKKSYRDQDDDNVSIRSSVTLKSKISNVSNLSTMSRSKLIDTKERIKLLMKRDVNIRNLSKVASHGALMKKLENKINELDEE